MNDVNLLENQPIAWRPTEEIKQRAQLTRFMKQIGVSDFDELYQYSIDDVEQFTAEVLKFLDVKFDPPFEKLLDLSDGVEFPHWCVGGGFNVVSHCVDRWIGTEIENSAAIIWEGEEGNVETLTYSDLFEQIRFCAAGLRSEGFGKGDAIGIHLPMIPETVILLLAINRIGAIAVPVFSGYGVEAIATRMEAVGAKALFTIDNFPRRGKRVKASSVAFEAAEKCHTVRKVFKIQSKFREYSLEERRKLLKKRREEYEKLTAEEKAEYHKKRELERQAAKLEQEKAEQGFYKRLKKMGVPKEQIEKIRQERARIKAEIEKNREAGISTFSLTSVGSIIISNESFRSEYAFQVSSWRELLRNGKENLEKLSHLELTSAEDPLIILYTSGTTGKPKGIAHTHCSFPIKAAQDMAFGTDVGRGTRICWITDIGWMMGPWLIYGALMLGGTIIIYDGAPDYPQADRMWEFCAKHKVEILGISPTLVRALATHGDELSKKHDLSSLRAFASTGEPWNPAPWWWLFEKVGDSKIPIINYSGGTEISGGILMGNPLLPIKPCSFPAPCPGIAADILDEEGNSVAPGEVGELAIKKPWIGMARGFWQERERYLETYWNRFEGVWVHGDFAMRDANGHWFILGRSDDTLKVAGKRVGPAEVESLLVGDERVAEAAVIGVPDEIKGTAMVAFCVLNSETTENLESELKTLVAKDMGKPLSPKMIYFVKALPKTRNAKVMRRVIRAAYLGEDAGDLSALENPKSVEEIQHLEIK